MGNTCPDICDAILVAMCHECPNFKTCQNYEDEANHDQMLECINHLFVVRYPTSFEDVDRIGHTNEDADNLTKEDRQRASNKLDVAVKLLTDVEQFLIARDGEDVASETMIGKAICYADNEVRHSL